MRRKRLIRPPMPGCTLELMNDNSHCEVQVRVQNDLCGLLIASDDALGSPIATSQAYFDCAAEGGGAKSQPPASSQLQAPRPNLVPSCSSSADSSYAYDYRHPRHMMADERSVRTDGADAHTGCAHNKMYDSNKDGHTRGVASILSNKNSSSTNCNGDVCSHTTDDAASFTLTTAAVGHGNTSGSAVMKKELDRTGLNICAKSSSRRTGGGKGSTTTVAGGSSHPDTAVAAASATVRSPSTAAKFIHVNNTNLFVLIDGVSMFVEGTGSCGGEKDPLLIQMARKQKNKKAGSVASSRNSVSMNLSSSTLSQHSAPCGCAKGNVTGLERGFSRTLCVDGEESMTGEIGHADSVADAIRDIELTDGVAAPSMSSRVGGSASSGLPAGSSCRGARAVGEEEELAPSMSTTVLTCSNKNNHHNRNDNHTATSSRSLAPIATAVTSASAAVIPTTPLTVEQRRSTPTLPSSFVGLFANARRPAMTHQFIRVGTGSRSGGSTTAICTAASSAASTTQACALQSGSSECAGGHVRCRTVCTHITNNSARQKEGLSGDDNRSHHDTDVNSFDDDNGDNSKSNDDKGNYQPEPSSFRAENKVCQDGHASRIHKCAGTEVGHATSTIPHNSGDSKSDGTGTDKNKNNDKKNDSSRHTESIDSDCNVSQTHTSDSKSMDGGKRTHNSDDSSSIGRNSLAAPTGERGTPLQRIDDAANGGRSFDTDDVEILDYIGGGTQGKVYRVRVDGKHYALKCIDILDTLHSTSAVERQGRKRGLAKELNMIRLQRQRPPCTHLMKMYNAAVSEVAQRKKVSLLMELMAFSLEDAQKMVARIPQNELMKISQAAFGDMPTGRAERDEDRRLKHELGSCMHILGRRSYDAPEDWEKKMDRQTGLPEVVLSMIAADVLRGLRELHEDYRIVHCDLKPDNVLLNEDRQTFKLADFGCGCAMYDGAGGSVRLTGIDLGSKLYKAPERLSDAPLSWDAPSMVPTSCAPMHERTTTTATTTNTTTTTTTTAAARIDEMKNTSNCCSRSTTESGAPWSAESAGGSESKDEISFTAKADVWSLGIMLLELSCGVHPCSAFKSDFWNYTSLLKLTKMVKPLTWSYAFFDFITRCVCVDVQRRWSTERLLQHPFVRRYDEVRRSKLKRFMDRLESESTTFQRKQQLALLEKQILLSTANRAKDNDKKKSLQKWQGFTGFLKEAPLLTDTTKFPPLRPCA